MKIAVLGSGSWGTSLAILLARNDYEVCLMGRDEEEIASLKSFRENLRYLPGYAIPPSVSFEMLSAELPVSDMTVIAVPSGAVRQVASEIGGESPLVVVCAKGLEGGSAKLLTEVVREVKPNASIGVLSGPNLAVEIVRGVPTVAVAGFADRDNAERVQRAFNSAHFRVSISNDVMGIELAGALKNVLAIGAGMGDGLGFGENTKGAFLSRGLMEMSKLGVAMGARLDTFLGPAGVGDLFATAGSKLSRNYRVGRALGEGVSLGEALETTAQAVEGVPTCEATMILARQFDVEMPVFAAVESVVRGRVAPRQAVGLLMDRASKMSDFL